MDDVIAFIADQQADPTRRITYVGEDAEGIRAELGALSPPWTETVRTARDGERLTGVSIVEWDAELRRAWVLGPWVEGDWTIAAGLVDAALAQVPAEVTCYELAGDIANTRLADLAAARGWTATEPNHVLIADASVVASWPDPEVPFRPAVPGDIDAITLLHEAEFPGTFASAAQLVEGTRTTIVADDAGRLVGYAAGEVHEDGEGFLDFLAVDPAARRTGLGRRLVIAITRTLLAESPLQRVALTVQDHRAPARALYERLGFRPDGILVAYRNWA